MMILIDEYRKYMIKWYTNTFAIGRSDYNWLDSTLLNSSPEKLLQTANQFNVESGLYDLNFIPYQQFIIENRNKNINKILKN